MRDATCDRRERIGTRVRGERIGTRERTRSLPSEAQEVSA